MNLSDPLDGCRGILEQKMSATERYVIICIMTSTIIVSFIGNLLVIVSIYKFKTLQTTTNTIICSLAVTDLLAPISRLLFIVISTFRKRWIFGCDWCIVSAQMGMWFGACSIAHLSAITIERYITIRYPFKYNTYITKSRIAVTVGIIWSVSLTLALLPSFGVVHHKFNANLLDCEIEFKNQPVLSVVLSLVYFLAPALLMVLIYGKIYVTVRSQTKKLYIAGIGTKKEKQKLRLKTELKAVKTVLIIIGLFFVLYLPFFCDLSINSYNPGSTPIWLNKICFCLLYINSCCNWVVYGVRNKKFRRAFMKLLGI